MKTSVLALAFLGLFVYATLLMASPPLSWPQQLASDVGPGYIDSFTVNCAGSATPISSTSFGSMMSYSCQTPASGETAGTVLVAIGDSGIADPDISTRNSPVYSGSTIREFGGNAKQEYCRADTGTVVIFCRALVAASVAP